MALIWKGTASAANIVNAGTTVEERAVSVPDLLASVSLALGVDFMKQNASNVGRPIRIVEPTAKPIKEVLA